MRFLVVEDEKKLSSFLRKGLMEDNLVVDLLHRGDEALERILSEPYDAVILDIMLPGRDGLSILREMRQRHLNTPVLLLSARGNVNERVEGFEPRGRRLSAEAVFHERGGGASASTLASRFGRARDAHASGRSVA